MHRSLDGGVVRSIPHRFLLLTLGAMMYPVSPLTCSPLDHLPLRLTADSMLKQGLEATMLFPQFQVASDACQAEIQAYTDAAEVSCKLNKELGIWNYGDFWLNTVFPSAAQNAPSTNGAPYNTMMPTTWLPYSEATSTSPSSTLSTSPPSRSSPTSASPTATLAAHGVSGPMTLSLPRVRNPCNFRPGHDPHHRRGVLPVRHS